MFFYIVNSVWNSSMYNYIFNVSFVGVPLILRLKKFLNCVGGKDVVFYCFPYVHYSCFPYESYCMTIINCFQHQNLGPFVTLIVKSNMLFDLMNSA